MNTFKIIVIIILSLEALGTFVAYFKGSEDCQITDVILLAIALLYVILN